MAAVMGEGFDLRAVLKAARRELLSLPADRPLRVIGMVLFALCLLGVAVSASRWFDGGVDGILSQRPTPAGFQVVQLREGAAADAAGLRVGDVIVARDGIPATDREAYWAARRASHARQAVVLSVRPAGSTAIEQRRLALTPILLIPDQAALFAVLVLVLVLIPATGVVVFVARPRERGARLFFAATLVHTAGTTLFLWDKAVGQTVDPVWHWYAYVPPRYLAASLYTHLLFVFPVVHPWFVRPRRLDWRALRWAAALVIVYVIPVAGVTYLIADSFPAPFDFGALQPPAPERIAALRDFSVLPNVLTVAAVAYGYWRAKSPAARGAIGWLALAVAVRLVTALWTAPRQVPFTGGQIEPLSPTLVEISALGVFSTIGLALVRYRLFEVSPWVRNAIVYPLAIAILVGAYDLLAGAIARTFGAVLGGDLSASPLLAGVPILLIVTLLRPVRRRLQGLLDRTLDRSRSEVQAFAAGTEATLSHTKDLSIEAVLTTRAAADLHLVGAWLLDPSAGGSLHSEPAPDDVGAAIELVVPGPDGSVRRVGRWILGRRMNADPFDDVQLRILTRVAEAAALRLDHQRLLAELRPNQEQRGESLTHPPHPL